MEEHLKDMMQELGNAINESLSESERISAAIGEIKRAGYEVFLVLEATIGFNKRAEEDLGSEEEAGATDEAALADQEPLLAEPAPPRPISRRDFKTAGKIKWTSQDQKFLRALKIVVDNESHT